MALGPQPGVSQIFAAIRTPDTRLDSLQRLKHIILGHDEQKLEYVRAGLVDFLLSVLEDDLNNWQTRSKESLEAQTDVIIILGSLARGGSAFLRASQIESLVRLLLGLLESHPSFAPLLESTLRALNSLLSLPAVSQNPEIISMVQTGLPILESISHVLNNSSSSRDFASYQAILLIPKSCTQGDSRRQDEIVGTGILAALVRRLGKLIRAIQELRAVKGNGLLKMERPFIERAPLSKSSSTVSLRYQRRDIGRHFDRLPSSEQIPIPSASYVAALLDAIACIVRGSKFRSDEVLFSSWITDVLGEQALQEPPRPPPIWRDSKPSDDSQAGGSSSGGYHYAGQDFPPLSPSSERHPHNRSNASGNALHPTTSYPPAEHSLDNEKPKIPQITHLRFAGETANDPESPFIHWLITYIRHEKEPLTRLVAVGLLTDLVHAGCVSKKNVKKIGLFIVPMLVRYLDEPDTSTVTVKKAYDLSFQAQETEWAVREQAPTILATLLTDNQRLQAAAVESGAVKRLTGMLKRAFDAIPAGSEIDGSLFEAHDMLWNEKLRAHQLKVREGTLRALAAIALFEDDHRKKIIDSGALAFVVGSLTPEPSLEDSDVHDVDLVMGGMQDYALTGSQLPTVPENDAAASFSPPETSRTGNPVPVLIAATNVVRSLSRSVNVLSTSLIDWTVSEPLFRLLSHESIQVRIAATAALCNLVMEFSPLRKGLEEKGIVKALGDLVRTGDENVCLYRRDGTYAGDFDSNKEALRLNAIWALKHLVLKQDEPIIASCLSAFGTEWLLEQVALQDSSETENTVSSGGGRRILESHGIEFSDRVMDRLASNYSPPNTDEQRRKALLEFQEQALDFFRNIMAGSYASSVFKKILKDTEKMIVPTTLDAKSRPLNRPPTQPHHKTPFYDVLTEKLKSKPGEKIVLAIIYVLVHIGACPEHRSLLIEQSSLFHELIELFKMQVDQIRIGLSWLAINLTWKENNGSSADFTLRVRRLREYKYVEMLEMLGKGGFNGADEGGGKSSRGLGDGSTIGEMSSAGDSDADVNRNSQSINMSLDLRERCRQALAQINDQ
ncbi:hypothetical protein ABW19_dt0206050 [Dactylella cylindrospora]|nr:hypothetical protein ABW19_dt0206050 [Dactylella cylindrospora]